MLKVTGIVGHFQVPLCLCFKASQVQNHSFENDFDLHENETACRTHFHMKRFALRLVLKQRQKRTRKWPIGHAFYMGPVVIPAVSFRINLDSLA